MHFLKLDVGQVYRKIEHEENERRASTHGSPKFGYIPLMAECHLGCRMSSSFSERVNSAAKLLLGERRACLSDEELEMICILRINRVFMEYMYANYEALLR